ncbi:hypothetical protein [Bauldia sp.]|uniref:hypothetical protein n=1 Tax=Bauldia sp. TaxID=2575872 RepID=UPI003BA99229
MRCKAVALAAGLMFVAGPVLAQGYYGAPRSGDPMYSSQSIVTGDVTLALGWYDPDKGNDETGEILGGVRIAVPLNELWNAQLEISGMSQFEGAKSEAYGGFGHIYYKGPQFAIGGVFGGSSVDGDGAYTAGAEKAFFMPSTTLKSNALYTWSDEIDDYWSIGGELGWYWNANTRADFGARYWSFEDEIWQFWTGVEHLIGGTNMSVFGEANIYTNNNITDWELVAGGRYAFGRSGASLQQHDWDRPFSVQLNHDLDRIRD